MDKAKSSVPLAQLEEEIKIISQLDHPNVIKIYEYFEDPKYAPIIDYNEGLEHQIYSPHYGGLLGR